MIDAGVRDVTTSRAMDFPVWAKAISAQGHGEGYGRFGQCRLVVCAGAHTWQPGDVIVADAGWGGRCPASDGRRGGAAGPGADHQRKRRHASASRQGELGLDFYGFRKKLTDLGVVYQDEE